MSLRGEAQPLQIRTLLNDCLTDEEQGPVSGRNPLASINETLRDGKFGRDRSKVAI
jgi:exocyst complex component 4